MLQPSTFSSLNFDGPVIEINHETDSPFSFDSSSLQTAPHESTTSSWDEAEAELVDRIHLFSHSPSSDPDQSRVNLRFAADPPFQIRTLAHPEFEWFDVVGSPFAIASSPSDDARPVHPHPPLLSLSDDDELATIRIPTNTPTTKSPAFDLEDSHHAAEGDARLISDCCTLEDFLRRELSARLGLHKCIIKDLADPLQFPLIRRFHHHQCLLVLRYFRETPSSAALSSSLPTLAGMSARMAILFSSRFVLTLHERELLPLWRAKRHWPAQGARQSAFKLLHGVVLAVLRSFEPELLRLNALLQATGRRLFQSTADDIKALYLAQRRAEIIRRIMGYSRDVLIHFHQQHQLGFFFPDQKRDEQRQCGGEKERKVGGGEKERKVGGGEKERKAGGGEKKRKNDDEKKRKNDDEKEIKDGEQWHGETVGSLRLSHLEDLAETASSLAERSNQIKTLSESLISTYSGVAAHASDRTLRWLTILSALQMPLIFFSAIYGMNFNQPEKAWGYPIYFWTMEAALILALLLLFKWKKWF